jgi:endonuclease G, mitochondrial
MARLRAEATNEYSSIVRDAGQRWQKRAKALQAAKKNIARGAWTKLDTSERLFERAERLGRWVAATLDQKEVSSEEALGLALAVASEGPGLQRAKLLKKAGAEAVEMRNTPSRLDSSTFERIIGVSRDLLSIEFFEQGLHSAQSVGLVSTDGAENGTGFLVAPGLMITNWHVIQDDEMAARSDLMLDFEANRFGPDKPTQIFSLSPKKFFLTNPDLDYTLVAVEQILSNGRSLAEYGFHPLIGKIGKAVVGECVNIIQHPGGKVKQIAMRNNRLLDLPGESEPGDEEWDPYFLYEADTEKGSSGSPVFNDQWEVIALHHAAVPKMKDGRLTDAKGNVLEERDGDAHVQWIANEGIRVSRIVADVVKAGSQIPDEMRDEWSGLLKVWDAQDLGRVQGPISSRSQSIRPESPDLDYSQPAALSIPTFAGGRVRTPELATSGPEIDVVLPLCITFRIGAPEFVRGCERSRSTATAGTQLVNEDPEGAQQWPHVLSGPGCR